MPAYLTADIIGFMLVFARVGAMLSLMPGFSDESTPMRLRLMLGLFLAAIIYPTVLLDLPPTPKSMPALGVLMFREIVLGVMLGGASRLILQALHVTGSIIANQIGIAAATLFDPSQGGQATVVTRFMGVMGVVMIFSFNLHHSLIIGVARSYALFAPGSPLLTADFAKMSTDIVAQTFALGVQLSAPFLVFGLIFNVGLGLISRLVPSLQVFFVAQPLTLLFGFALLAAVIGTTMTVFVERFATLLAPMIGVH